MTSREKKIFFRYKHKHTHTLSALSPVPHWTGQPGGLLGIMERLYEEVGFEVCFEGSKEKRLTDCRLKGVSDSRGLIPLIAMSKRFEFVFVFLFFFSQGTLSSFS